MLDWQDSHSDICSSNSSLDFSYLVKNSELDIKLPALAGFCRSRSHWSINASNASILRAKYGFAAYRKKPEYGPATIIVENMKQMNAVHLDLLEKGSLMKYMSKEYRGKKMFDIDAMYAMYAK